VIDGLVTGAIPGPDDDPAGGTLAGRVVVNLTDLLHLTGCADLDELSALIDGDADADMSVVEIEGGIDVSTFGGATGLDYPFTLADFWEVVAETEEDEIRRWEQAEELA
jgi:hypothetical protein